jgi:hypothetical protein
MTEDQKALNSIFADNLSTIFPHRNQINFVMQYFGLEQYVLFEKAPTPTPSKCTNKEGASTELIHATLLLTMTSALDLHFYPKLSHDL